MHCCGYLQLHLLIGSTARSTLRPHRRIKPIHPLNILVSRGRPPLDAAQKGKALHIRVFDVGDVVR